MNKLKLIPIIKNKTLDVHLYIDDKQIAQDYSIDVNGFESTFYDDCELEIFTCDCGIAGCAGIFKPVYTFLSEDGYSIVWRVQEPFVATYIFDKTMYMSAWYGFLTELFKLASLKELEHKITYFHTQYAKNILPQRTKELDNITQNTFCKGCGSSMKVMTIYDMLNTAKSFNVHNAPVKLVLDYLGIKLRDINILQNRERIEEKANNEICLKEKYHAIYGGKYPIYLKFSEDFKRLEGIEISTNFFSNYEVRNHLKIDENTSDEFLEKYLKNLFLLFGERFERILDELCVKDKIIKLRLPNERFEQKFACNFYPDTDAPYIYYDYCTDNTVSNIDNLTIGFENEYYDLSNLPYNIWLNQKIVTMFPDYGMSCFWFQGGSGIEFFEEYVKDGSDLHVRFEKWLRDFYDCEEDGFDWDEFNKRGKQLHNELQEIVSANYIIVYEQSFEEVEARRKRLGFEDGKF